MKGRLSLFFVISILVISMVNQSQTNTKVSQSNAIQPSNLRNSIVYTPSDYVSHGLVNISSDDDFLLYGFPGNGTLNNPYVIDSLNISISEDNVACISITHVTVAFEIRNCCISNPKGYGIYLYSLSSSSYVNVSNNKIFNCDVGIRLGAVDYPHIQMNQFVQNSRGLDVSYCYEGKYVYNAFINNTQSVRNSDNYYQRSFYEYNYWSGLSPIDANSDGIIDNPYEINSYWNYIDPHPLLQIPGSYNGDTKGPTMIPSFKNQYETEEEFEIAVDIMDVSGVSEVSITYWIDDSFWFAENLTWDLERYFTILEEQEKSETTIPYWYSSNLSFSYECNLTFRVQAKDKLGNEVQSLTESILVFEDLYPPTFGYSWEFYQTETIGFLVTQGGGEGVYSRNFTNTVFDKSGIDTILLYYKIEPVGSTGEESWIKYDAVSYDEDTHIVSTTLYFNPPIYNAWVYAYYWANDTFGHESKGGLQGFCYSSGGPIGPLFRNVQFIFLISIVGIVGLIVIVKLKRRDYPFSD
ncbi:MAG: NosD domain-containing protein [Candidatus Thorarchaeota archaeon]